MKHFPYLRFPYTTDTDLTAAGTASRYSTANFSVGKPERINYMEIRLYCLGSLLVQENYHSICLYPSTSALQCIYLSIFLPSVIGQYGEPVVQDHLHSSLIFFPWGETKFPTLVISVAVPLHKFPFEHLL